MSLMADITDWKSSTAAAMLSVYSKYSNDSRFIKTLIEALTIPACQRAASWLIKHYLEDKQHNQPHHFSAEFCNSFYASVSVLQHWEAKLHILQCMEKINIPEHQKQNVYSFLQQCATSDNKFVRAWAYSGLQVFASRFTDVEANVYEQLKSAYESEKAASVKVRLRKALNTYEDALTEKINQTS